MQRIISYIVCLLVGTASFAQTAMEREAYLTWMEDNLPECPEFHAWADSTGAVAPDFEALPRQNLLPDPYTFFDGRKVRTSADWELRRQEIVSLFERYEWGSFPEKPAIDRVEVLDEKVSGGIVSRTVKLHFGPEGKGNVRVSISYPDDNSGRKYPVLLSTMLGGMGNSLLRRGYISAGFAGSDFMDDGAALKALYPEHNFSKLARRAWLISLVIDYFETVPQVDMDKIAVYGYSRDGKMASIAAARDERIAALVAGSTGVGGFVPWRYAGERGGGESIESTTRMFPDWFIPELRFFSGKEDRLPVDANLLLAAIAPRAVLMEWGLNDEVANGWAQEQAYASALPVYESFGAADKLSLLAVPGFHGSNDMDKCIDFLDSVFGRTGTKWSYEPVFAWDYDAWARRHADKFNVREFPVHKSGSSIANSIYDWRNGKEARRQTVRQMMGKKPLTMESSGRGGFFFGGRSLGGPVEALDGKFNPGQLGPDVPAWVISKRSSEFGWTPEDGAAAASKRVNFGPDNVRGDLYYPAGTPEGSKLPVVIWLHGYHYPLGYMWVYRRDIHPILALVQEGYAVLAYDQTGFGMRYDEYAPFYERYPEWSRLGRMVEDVSSAIDALQKEALVDGDNITVLGYTMGGTVALHAAALDERIDNVVSVCGFTPMRLDTGKDGLSGMTRYSHLYGMQPMLGLFKGNENRLPYDFDDLIALTAPRGVLIVQPSMDRDADTKAVRNAVSRASLVYRWEGAQDKLELKEPEDYGRFTAMTQINVIEWIKKNTK